MASGSSFCPLLEADNSNKLAEPFDKAFDKVD